MNLNPDGFFIISTKGEILEVNNTYCLMSGYSREELIGQKLQILDDFNMKDLLSKSRKEALYRGDAVRFNRTHTKKDGSDLPVEISARFVDPNDREYLAAFCRDLTEVTLCRERIQKQDQIMNNLFDQIPAAAYEILSCPDGSIRMPFASKNFRDLYGLKSDVNITEDATIAFQTIHPEDLDRVMASMNQAIEDYSFWKCDFRICPPGNDLRWIRGQATPQRQSDGCILWSGFMMDVTDLKETHRKLEELSARQNSIIEGTGAGTWEWNVQTGEVIINPRGAEILGYSLSEIGRVAYKTNIWTDMAYLEDQDKVVTVLNEHLEAKSDFLDLDCRMRHRNGTPVWVNIRGKVISRTVDGEPLWMYGTTADISRRKSLELAIQQGLEEKQILLKELKHRVVNSFTVIHSMISILKYSENSGREMSGLEKIENKISSIALMYDLLYATGSVNSVSLDEYLQRVLDTFPEDFGRITLLSRLDPLEIGVDQAVAVGIIVNELLTNSYKYAFPEKAQGMIQVTMKKTGDSVEVSVSDDGIGFDLKQVQNEGSFGQTMIMALLKQLNAELEVQYSRGTFVKFEFPLEKIDR